MRKLVFILCLSLLGVAAHAQSADESALIKKILAQGAPEHGVHKLFDYIDHQMGAKFTVDSYSCSNRKDGDLRPCEEEKRTKNTTDLTLEARDYAVIVDFALPSTEKRFFLINLKTGDVQRFLTTHGRGSGQNVAYKFSNTKDSDQTSLGMYMIGPIYVGDHGRTMRLYGLEKSNNQVYNRDIVIHSADYADADFITRINPSTKQPYGRLGLSWGCPALADDIMKKMIPILQAGTLMYLDHKDLAEEALGGNEVVGALPAELVPIPRPRPNPVHVEQSGNDTATKGTNKDGTPATEPNKAPDSTGASTDKDAAGKQEGQMGANDSSDAGLHAK